MAYAFTRWLLEDGTVLGPDGFRLAPPLSAAARGGVVAAVEVRRRLTLALALTLTRTLTLI